MLGDPWQTAQGQSRLGVAAAPGRHPLPGGACWEVLHQAGESHTEGAPAADSPGRVPGHWAATGRRDAPPSLRQGKVPEGISEAMVVMVGFHKHGERPESLR